MTTALKTYMIPLYGQLLWVLLLEVGPDRGVAAVEVLSDYETQAYEGVLDRPYL